MNKNPVEQTKPAETSLITLERSQKLDLLTHLISNLKQSLVICGPNGIGKTTLLNVLKSSAKVVWPIISIQATSNHSFESIQKQLSDSLKQQYPEYSNQEFAALLSALDKQKNKLVILIDDAGLLVPGLITTLIHFAEANSCLRIVFALTHDELHIKNSSDQVIDDCHFIEIPPLTEKQCGVFLQQLSAQPNAIVAYKSINDRLIEKLYRETHGIPGKIISDLPKLSNYSVTGNHAWIGIVVIVALLVTAISLYLSYDSKQKPAVEIAETRLVLPRKSEIRHKSPTIESISEEGVNDLPGETSQDDLFGFAENKITKNSHVENIDENKTDEIDFQQPLDPGESIEFRPIELEKEAINTIEKNSLPVMEKTQAHEEGPNNSIIEQTVETANVQPITVVEDKKTTAKIEKITTLDDKQWILSQPEKNYTLQLMVLSKRESVDKFLKKNRKLKDNLKIIQKNKYDKTKYIVIFGSFKSIMAASNSMKSLPPAYRKSWVRKFRELQKIINK